jgi:chaperonin GroES
MARASTSAIRRREVVNAPKPRGVIDTRDQSREDQVGFFTAGGSANKDDIDDVPALPDADTPRESPNDKSALERIIKLADYTGNLMDVLPPGVCHAMAEDAIREWEIDLASRKRWEDVAERGLILAEQEDDADEAGQKDYPFEGAADVHYPILTTAALQFQARVLPAIIRGDEVFGVKTFDPPAQRPSPLQIAKGAPQPQDPATAQQQGQQVQADSQQMQMQDLAAEARSARAKRVKMYLNYTVFYKMDNWAGETDQLMMEMPIVGIGFKKTYKGKAGIQTDYVSGLRLVVNNAAKSLRRAPRITQEFDIYPYEIDEGIREGRYAEVSLAVMGDDPEAAREWIEQHRMEDLDGDGMAEPYIVTIDVRERRCMRIEAAFTADDVVIDEVKQRVKRIDRHVQFATYLFLPSPRGGLYGLGLARLLQTITDSVDTSLNQLIDAGNAQIAGGGFIGSQVRLQGSGQGGAVYFQPGEFKTVSMAGQDIRQAIWERTVPQPSDVALKTLELLIAAAKDIASVKDVVTGDTPATAPVGTTMALQDQALTVFSSIFSRLYRGLGEEAQNTYQAIKRYADAEMRAEYRELTGGDLDEDFKGDGTDIRPAADPRVVTKMQKIARVQSTLQLAESPIGEAAGMTQPQQAQEIATECLNTMDWERPERFIGQPSPDPEKLATVAKTQAEATLKQAQARTEGAAATLDEAKTIREAGLTAKDTHQLHQEADRVAQQGLQPPAEGDQNADQPTPPDPGLGPTGPGDGASPL